MPYPDSFTTITIPAGDAPLSTGSHTDTHQAEVDAVTRIEQTLGLNPGDGTTVALRLAGFATAISALSTGKENTGVAAGLVTALANTLGNSSTRNVGTVGGTVAAGDDTGLVAARAAALRVGAEVIGSNTFTIDTATKSLKTRAATGAVTIDVRADNLVSGNDTTTRTTNTTGGDIAVSVVAVGLDWYTPATVTVPAGKSATLSLLPTTTALSGVLASLVVSV